MEAHNKMDPTEFLASLRASRAETDETPKARAVKSLPDARTVIVSASEIILRMNANADKAEDFRKRMLAAGFDSKEVNEVVAIKFASVTKNDVLNASKNLNSVIGLVEEIVSRVKNITDLHTKLNATRTLIEVFGVYLPPSVTK